VVKRTLSAGSGQLEVSTERLMVIIGVARNPKIVHPATKIVNPHLDQRPL
jgi:hypothetical protein